MRMRDFRDMIQEADLDFFQICAAVLLIFIALIITLWENFFKKIKGDEE